VSTSPQDPQLTLSALWSEKGPLPELHLDAPKREPTIDLLDGPHVYRSELEAACDALDAPRLEATLAALVARFPPPPWADHVAPAIAWVKSLDSMSAREQLDAAWRGGVTDDRFAQRARSAALRRALRRVLEAEGPGAELADGTPVAGLARSLSDDALATQLLWDACEARPDRGAWWLVLARQAGAREDVATRAWCRALLIDPELDDEALTRCAPVQRLLDEAEELELERASRWLAVLADLKRLVLLDERALPSGDHEVHRLARDLWRYRRDRASLTEAERLERKRELVRARPELKPWWRTLS